MSRHFCKCVACCVVASVMASAVLSDYSGNGGAWLRGRMGVPGTAPDGTPPSSAGRFAPNPVKSPLLVKSAVDISLSGTPIRPLRQAPPLPQWLKLTMHQLQDTATTSRPCPKPNRDLSNSPHRYHRPRLSRYTITYATVWLDCIHMFYLKHHLSHSTVRSRQLISISALGSGSDLWRVAGCGHDCRNIVVCCARVWRNVRRYFCLGAQF